MIKVIVAGSREFQDYDLLARTLDKVPRPFEVVCGMSAGGDKLGRRYAHHNDLPVKEFPADWESLGKRAGPIRNTQMGDYADALIAFWDGKSRGTAHMIDYAKKKGLKVLVIRFDKE
jgi:hypothetical protein